MEPTVTILILACLTAFAGAMVQCTVGFGFGFVVAPTLALLFTPYVPMSIIQCGTLTTIFVVLRERQQMDVAGLKWAIPGFVPGVIAAVLVLKLVATDLLSVVLGVIILAGVLLSCSGWSLPMNRQNLFGAGSFSGFMGTITGIGAPPILLVYQRSATPQLRATLGGFFLAGNICSLFALWWVDLLGKEEFLRTIPLLGATLLGCIVAQPLRKHVDRLRLRGFILTFSAVSSILVILKGVF